VARSPGGIVEGMGFLVRLLVQRRRHRLTTLIVASVTVVTFPPQDFPPLRWLLSTYLLVALIFRHSQRVIERPKCIVAFSAGLILTLGLPRSFGQRAAPLAGGGLDLRGSSASVSWSTDSGGACSGALGILCCSAGSSASSSARSFRQDQA
jgi:hypothetical protein